MKQEISESWQVIFHGKTRFETSKTFYDELILYVSYLSYNFEIHRKPYGINFSFDNQSTFLNVLYKEIE
jgi:hypothetical protein